MKKIILILLLLLSSFYYLGYTTSGLHTIIDVASCFMPGQLNIKFNGTFAKHIRIDHLYYQDQQTEILIDHANLDWSPRYLINQEMVIKKLQAQRINITTKNNKQSASLSNPFLFLKYLYLNKSKIDQLNINYNNQTITVNQISIDKHASGDHQIKIKSATLNGKQVTFELKGRINHDWDLQWIIKIPQLNSIYPKLSGSLNISGKIQGERTKPTMHMNLQAKQLRYQDTRLDSLTGTITAQTKQQALLMNIQMNDHQNNQLSGLITFTKGLTDFSLSQAMKGRLKLKLANISLIKLISNEIKNPTGYASAELQLEGTLNHPNINASVSLSKIGFDLPRFAVKIRQLNINGSMNSPQQMSLKGSFLAGAGRGQLNGQINLDQLSLTTTISGTQLQTVDNRAYQLSVNPRVIFKFSPTEMSLVGDIAIPKARLILNDYYDVVTLPDEVKLTNEKQSKITLPKDLMLNLSLVLGHDIYVAYDKFEGNITGKLTINQISGRLATAYGEIHATKGTYQTYGKTLAISAARLMYTGNALTNPGIYIRAQQKFTTPSIQNGGNRFNSDTGLQATYTGATNITAGVQLTGSFQHPTVSLYSSPSGLSQGDILSYLMFGHPQSQAKSQNGAAVLSALSSIYTSGNSKVSGLTDKLKSTFAITDFGVESADIYDPTTNTLVPTTTIGIGKQLGRNLYLKLQVGVLNPVSILNMRYQLSKHFSLQSETSSFENGADLFYTIETD